LICADSLAKTRTMGEPTHYSGQLTLRQTVTPHHWVEYFDKVQGAVCTTTTLATSRQTLEAMNAGFLPSYAFITLQTKAK